MKKPAYKSFLALISLLVVGAITFPAYSKGMVKKEDALGEEPENPAEKKPTTKQLLSGEALTKEGIEQLKVDFDLQNLTATVPLFVEKAVFSFENRGAPGLKYLTDYLKKNKNDEQIVLAVLYTFGRMGEDAAKAIPVIIPYLENVNPQVRGTAVAALGKIGRPAEITIPSIKDRLFDNDKWVSELAYRALLQMNTSKSKRLAKNYKQAEEIKKERELLESGASADEIKKLKEGKKPGAIMLKESVSDPVTEIKPSEIGNTPTPETTSEQPSKD